jgi:hypothetical protein
MDCFGEALARVRAVTIRPEFRIDEAPAPQRLAPFAVALTVESTDEDDDLASGRFVLLHDPDGVDEWEGTFRAVVFVRAALEADLVSDPMLHEVGWSWLLEALEATGAQAVQIGGTVTRTAGQSFGSMSDRPSEGFVEIRASWTPTPSLSAPVEFEMDRHVQAWVELVSHAAGLPPIPSGITHVRPVRARAQS